MSAIRGQRAEDRRQIFVRAPRGLLNSRGEAATKPPSSVLCPLPPARGFSLFELVVVISIVAVLMAILLGRMLYYQEQAEKTVMAEVAGAIQSALIIQYGRILTRGKKSDVEWLVKDNPMNWLQQKPPNYAGEFHDLTPLTVETGNWVFDLDSRDLIYVPRLVNNFKPGKDGKQWIRYHVVVQYDPSRLPSLQNAPPELTGILFQPVEPYSWF
ncbi:MAG: type II secretion system protein [Gallionella sp.]|nr:type II secretion system protein [Gallionella sp.]